MKSILIEEIPAKVTVIYDATPFELPLHIRKQIQKFWDQQIEQNPYLRNGEVFTIKEISKTPEELLVTVAKTDYMHYLYTIRNEGFTYPVKVIFTCVSVITNDNYITFGRMNKHTSTPGRLQFTGGGLDEADLDGSIFDLEKSIGKELTEEMGLHMESPYVLSFNARFVKSEGIDDFWAIMFEMKVDYSAEELQIVFEKHNQSLIEQGELPEFEEFFFVSLNKKSVESFLQNDSAPKEEYLEPILRKYVGE